MIYDPPAPLRHHYHVRPSCGTRKGTSCGPNWAWLGQPARRMVQVRQAPPKPPLPLPLPLPSLPPVVPCPLPVPSVDGHTLQLQQLGLLIACATESRRQLRDAGQARQ